MKYFNELVFTRIVDAPREQVFKAWTDPGELEQWLAPAPWTVSIVQADPRPGAASVILMASPDGMALMSATVTFDELGHRTRYTARVRHLTITEQEVEAE